MYSVPDTAFSAAAAKFLQLFQQCPVTLAELHAAFADMAVVTARDHPEMPWPIRQTDGDGRVSTLTVEGWLAVLRSHYSRLPTSEDAAVLEKLALWHGAQAKATVTSKPWPTELQLHFSKKICTRQGKTFTEQLGVLAAPCAWRLCQKNAVVVSSATVDTQAQKVFSATLKGTKALAVRLEPGGVLVLVFNKDVSIEIQPDDFSVGPDYELHTSRFTYYRFTGNFVENEQVTPEDLPEFE